MVRSAAVSLAVLVMLGSVALAGDDPSAPPTTTTKPTATKPISDELQTPAAQLSYALGMEIGTFLKSLETDIDRDAFVRALKDALDKKDFLLTPEQADQIKNDFARKMQNDREAKAKALGEKNKKDGEAFLAENKKKAGVKTAASGLQYEVLKEGDGAKPKPTDQVKVHYRGTLLDKTEFDSSYNRKEPALIPLDGVIPGWSEGVLLMKVGSKYRLVLPASLAYGERGSGPIIGPNAVLIFEIELLGIEKASDMPILPQ